MRLAACLHFALVLVCVGPLVGHADCWTIETTSGKTIPTSDLWQIRSRITEKSELVGEVNGSKTSVDLTDVAELTIDQPGHRGKFDLHIRMLDESTLNLSSDMDLYYLTDEKKKKKHPIQLADISSVNRCLDEADSDSLIVPAVPAAALATTSSLQIPETGFVLVTTGGDVLNGKLTDDEIIWITSYGEVTFRPEDIKLIVFHCGLDQKGLLETFSGDRISGTVVNKKSVAVRLSTGQTLSIPAEQLKYIVRSEIRAENQDMAARCNIQQD